MTRIDAVSGPIPETTLVAREPSTCGDRAHALHLLISSIPSKALDISFTSLLIAFP